MPRMRQYSEKYMRFPFFTSFNIHLQAINPVRKAEINPVSMTKRPVPSIQFICSPDLVWAFS